MGWAKRKTGRKFCFFAQTLFEYNLFLNFKQILILGVTGQIHPRRAGSAHTAASWDGYARDGDGSTRATAVAGGPCRPVLEAAPPPGPAGA
jgi:hypothetical protein